MANEAGGQAFERLIAAESDHIATLEVCEAELPTLADDSTYWQLLLAAWTMQGREEAPYGERWLRLFQADRRNRKRGMKAAQRKVFNAFPQQVAIWRADAPEDTCLSWTTSRVVAHHFGRLWKRPVLHRLAYRHEIAFYTDRRLEAEAIIIPGDPQIPSYLRGQVSAAVLDTAPPPTEAAIARHRMMVMTGRRR